MKKLTVSIGIPAYNAEKNIKRLLSSLITQRGAKQTIKEIIVYSDGSSDSTLNECLKIKDKKGRLRIIKASKRRGMAVGLKFMLSVFKGDVFILLNDDIIIKDNNLIDRLVKPLLLYKRVGLISGRPVPLESKNFLQKSIYSTFRAYDYMKYSIKNGNNLFTCDGKILALSREFVKSIKFPKSNKLIGNVDAFLYLSCITSNHRYFHVKNAKIHFKFPAKLKDFISWNSRNNANQILLKKTFGEKVDDIYNKPARKLFFGILREVIKNPIGTAFIFTVGLFGKYKARQVAKDFKPAWEVIQSTKGGINDV